MKKWLAQCILRILGWKVEGTAPHSSKCILIAFPHTSNWDFIFMLCSAFVLQQPIFWMGKHTLFTGFLGLFLKKMGGVSVDRRKPQGLVDQISEEFSKREVFALAIPPEGTRSRASYWKSGFYTIARTADVPIVLTFLDYKSKTTGMFYIYWYN